MHQQADRTRAPKAALLAAFAVAWLSGAARAADAPPAPPYYTVQVETVSGKAKAIAAVKALGDVPAARAEKRSNGYVIRFGAWADKGPADAGLAKHKAGHKDAKVMYVTKPSDWLVASGETLKAGTKPVGAAKADTKVGEAETPAEPAATEAKAAPATEAKVATATEAAAPAQPVAAAPAAVPPPAKPAPVSADAFRAAAGQLDADLRGWLKNGPARSDGYTYGLDVATVLLYAAQRKDAALYDQVSPAARTLIVAGDDATLKGFVLWRHKDGADPEVTGSTEALWMARALWTGAKAFKKPDDRMLALQVLDGYARHAHGEATSWRVSKYYAFGTKTLASLSLLPNYMPDFVEETEALGSPRIRGIARKSYSVYQRAQTPSKLLVPVIQPELGDFLPAYGVSLYAPNGVVVLDDACAAAEGAQRGMPQLAKGLLEFAAAPERHDANGRLFAYYQRGNGQAIGDSVLSTGGYACLARLAAAAKDQKILPELKSVLLGDMKALSDAPEKNVAPLYGAGTLLRAADALKAL